MGRPRTQTDAAVLEAAARVFHRVGPHRFTLAEVGREANLSPATLLQRFGSKRGLLLAFANHAAAHAAAPFDRARERERSPLAMLRAALSISARDVSSRQSVVNGLAFLLEDLEDPELRRAAASHAKRTEAAIRALLDEAVVARELKTRDTAALARTVQAAFNGAVIQWALRGRGKLDVWVRETLDTVLGV